MKEVTNIFIETSLSTVIHMHGYTHNQQVGYTGHQIYSLTKNMIKQSNHKPDHHPWSQNFEDKSCHWLASDHYSISKSAHTHDT